MPTKLTQGEYERLYADALDYSASHPALKLKVEYAVGYGILVNGNLVMSMDDVKKESEK